MTDSAGSILRQEREKKGLSVSDVARQMRLSNYQIEAIEADNHEALPGKTFVRGFIKNYAKILQIDPDSLLQEADFPVASETAVLPRDEGIPFPNGDKKNPIQYGILALLLILPILAYVMYSGNEKPVEARKSQPVVAEPLAESSSPVALAPVVMDSAPVAAAESAPVAAESPVAKPLASAPALSKQAASSANGTPQIRLVFEEKSWTEIKDGDGAVIFSKNCEAGSEHEISGKPPFALVIGNAAHAKLFYKGKPVDLAPNTKVAVARLSLE